MELLERAAELERIAGAIAGSTGVVVVEGEAGIGKSALLEAGADLARDAGARVFLARGGVLERDFGYGVARQLFEAPVHRAGPAERRRWLAGAARLAAPVLGIEAPGEGRGDAGGIDDPAFAAQHGLHWLAVNIAAEGRVVLVVDDLQWSDPASLRWLVYLARRLEDVPLLVLAAWRTGEPDTPADLLAELPAERLVPGPLSLAATKALLTDRLGRSCDPATAEACHRGTSGNPFLLTEVAHALDEDTDLPLDAGRVAALGGRTVGRHVRARLARLPVPAGDVARAAAVLEGGMAPHHVARVAGLPLAEVRAACDRLVAARILADRGTLEFVHPLVRAAIYDALSPARRAAAHRTAADVLDREGRVDQAAVHLLAAERTGDPGVVERLATAADRARARGAVEEAIVLLRRALDEPPPPAARHALLVRLVQAMVLVGHEATIATARQALALADEPDEREAAALALAQALTYGERTDEALDVLRTTADALRERAPEHALRLDAERLSHSLMLPHVPRGTRGRALVLVAEVDPESLPAQTLRAVAACLGAVRGATPAPDAKALALAALGNGQLLADPSTESLVPGFYWALQALRGCEELDECDRWIARRWDLATCAGARLEWHVLAMHRAHVAGLRGEPATAVDEARFALAGRDVFGFRFFVPDAVAPLVDALVELGRLDEAEAALAEHGLGEGTTWSWFSLIPARVRLALARGDLARARAQVAAAPPEAADLALRMAPAEVAVALATGDRETARARAQAMLAAAERFGALGTLGIARRLVGQATGGAAGIEHLRAAIEPLERSPLRLELARALVELGAALRRANARGAAREPLRRGLDLAQRCGSEALTAQAMQELRATGARPRRLVLTGVESLTPSELRVARLVAEGRSNPEVAQALFVSRATVESHLAAVFRKLGLTSRDQLPAALGD